MNRTVVWFSCGAASAVCAKLLVESGRENVEIVYIKPGTAGVSGAEHPDNERFRRDVEKWIGREVQVLVNERFSDQFDVFDKVRYIAGISGAACTRTLKRDVRMSFERPDDVQVFGFTLEEGERARKFRERNPKITLLTPLIEEGLSKKDCLGLLWRAGIEIPVMYRLGYKHNNCLGCVKGGMGYWNKIRKDFPDTFAAAALIERDIGHAILKDEDGPVWLDVLDPARGNYSKEPSISCGLSCERTAQSFE